jgi:hypothetical protein
LCGVTGWTYFLIFRHARRVRTAKAAEHSRTIIAGMEDDLTIRLRIYWRDTMCGGVCPIGFLRLLPSNLCGLNRGCVIWTHKVHLSGYQNRIGEFNSGVSCVGVGFFQPFAFGAVHAPPRRACPRDARAKKLVQRKFNICASAPRCALVADDYTRYTIAAYDSQSLFVGRRHGAQEGLRISVEVSASRFLFQAARRTRVHFDEFLCSCSGARMANA